MKNVWFFVLCLVPFVVVQPASAAAPHHTDRFSTEAAELVVTFLGHASLMFEYKGMVVQVDPVRQVADYSTLPKADLILITHEHADHYDAGAIALVKTPKTKLIVNPAVRKIGGEGIVMANGDERTVSELTIRAVPAYNIVHKRENGEPFHPKGRDNGYVVTFGNRQVYIAGDTENIPEMQKLSGIEIAFLPMNLPYTMTPEMVADAVRSFNPKIVYPYHYRGTDPQALVALLKEQKPTEVRVRKMYDD